MTIALEPGMLLAESVTGDEAAFAVVDAADTRTPRLARSWVSLRRVGEHGWALTGIDTKAEFEGRGYGTALINKVRAWAAEHGHTVRTRNAMPNVYGFYERTGCRWVAEDEEFVVAPIPGQHEAPTA